MNTKEKLISDEFISSAIKQIDEKELNLVNLFINEYSSKLETALQTIQSSVTNEEFLKELKKLT